MTSSPIKIVFFGSFLDYSVQVLKLLVESPLVEVMAVVTTPPKPAGRTQELKKTAVHLFAQQENLPVFAPEKLDENSLADLSEMINEKPTFSVTAGYGKLLPPSWLNFPSNSSLNIHFSLLPHYRGANPVEWALLVGENQVGVTIIEMNPDFDQGDIIAQDAIDVSSEDTRESLYEKLYELGGKLVLTVLPKYSEFEAKPQPDKVYPYAKRLNRQDGFVSWQALTLATQGQAAALESFSPNLQEAAKFAHRKSCEKNGVVCVPTQNVDVEFVERAVRALLGFPGVWTTVPTAKGEKRMKILSAKIDGGKLVLDQVQLDGQAPALWNQVKNAVI